MAISKRTRIAIVAASAPPLSSGGVASAHYNLFRALRRRGYNAQLFTFFDNGKLPKLKEAHVVRNGAPIWFINFITKLVSSFFGLVDPAEQGYQTTDILRSSLGAIRMGMAIDRYRAEVVILSDHGAPGLWVSKKRGRKILLVSHHNPKRFAEELMLGNSSVSDTAFAVWLENLVLRRVDEVICPSGYMENWFYQTYRYSKRVHRVPNLMDSEQVASLRPADIRKLVGTKKTARVLYLPSAGTVLKGSRFVPELLKLLAKNHLGQIVVYMPGRVEPALRPTLDEYSSSFAFYLPGQVSYEDHLAFVKDCDAGISPALMENFSMAILEAAFLGVPMLVFDRGGNKDIIEDGKNGYLIDPFQVKPLAKKALDILGSDYLADFKKRTAAFTRHKFDANKVLDSYLELAG